MSPGVPLSHLYWQAVIGMGKYFCTHNYPHHPNLRTPFTLFRASVCYWYNIALGCLSQPKTPKPKIKERSQKLYLLTGK